MSETLS